VSLPLSIVAELALSIVGISLGTTIGVVTSLATSEARVTTSGSRGVVPHRCSSRDVLAILRNVGMLRRLISTLSLLLLVLLVGALVLILRVVDTLSSSAKRCFVRGCETRA
jgi:hypothetical protein